MNKLADLELDAILSDAGLSRNQKIVAMRKAGLRGKTIGKRFGLTRQRVYQIVARADRLPTSFEERQARRKQQRAEREALQALNAKRLAQRAVREHVDAIEESARRLVKKALPNADWQTIKRVAAKVAKTIPRAEGG